MIKQEDLNLLNDLVKLWKKYGPESFERLRNLLRSGEMPAEMESVLTTVTTSAKIKAMQKKTSVLKSKEMRPHAESQLPYLRNSQPAKYDILKQFYEEMREKKILAMTRDVVSFSAHIGLVVPKKASRDIIIGRIMTYLSQEPLEQIKIWVEEARKSGTTGQTLDEWADIILKRKDGQ